MPSRVNQLTRNLKERVVWTDFTPNLNLNPTTKELLILKNSQAVSQSIYNLVQTWPGERYYQPSLGCLVSKENFEFIDDFAADRIKESIMNTIQVYEPRAQNLVVNVTADPPNHYVLVTIQYTLALFPNQTFNVPVTLRVR